MSIAFFDLDRTLLSKNSGTLWVQFELRHGIISWMQAARALYWIGRYQLGMARVEDALLESITVYAGMREEDVHQRTLSFYEEMVRDWYRPGAREALESHRQAGDKLVLLSSTTNYMAQEVAADLGLDDILCTRLEVDAQGRYTGRPNGPLCYGEGKVVHAQRMLERLGVSPSDCSFYTDSWSDLPMLEAVGKPVVVHPDPRLRRFASRRGWPILDWGEPGRRAAA